MTTHYHTTFYDGTEPADPRTRDLGNGKVVLNLPGCLDIQAPRDYLARLLQAGLDALTDGTVAWGPDGAEVVPLRRPGKRRVTIGVDDDQLAALARHVELAEAVEVANMPTARLARDILAAAAEPEQECTCVRYDVNPDDPSEGTDVTAASRESCPIHGTQEEVGPKRNAGRAMTLAQADNRVAPCQACGAARTIDDDGTRGALLVYECATCDAWLREGARPGAA